MASSGEAPMTQAQIRLASVVLLVVPCALLTLQLLTLCAAQNIYNRKCDEDNGQCAAILQIQVRT